jgi:hypothetical protein
MAPCEPTKVCLRCKQEKPLSAFNVDRVRKDGRHPYCTACKTAPYSKSKARAARREAIRNRTHKVCSACKLDKAIEDFHVSKNSLDGHHGQCKVCALTVAKAYGQSPKAKLRAGKRWVAIREKSLAAIKTLRDSRKLDFIRRLGGKCHDCERAPGEIWPLACFDFHHPDPVAKEGVIGRLLATKEEFKAWAEASKCQVLCACCHRRRHALEHD